MDKWCSFSQAPRWQRLLSWLLLSASLLLGGCNPTSAGVQPPTPFQSGPAASSPTDFPTPAQEASTSSVESPTPAITLLPSDAPALPTPEASPTSSPYVTEVAVQEFPLAGLPAGAGITGMAWYQDTLILLPENPALFSSSPNDGSLWTISKSEILAYLNGQNPDPLSPGVLPLVAPGLAQKTKDFTGFEALAIDGENVYVSLIGSSSTGPSYLVRGTLTPQLSAMRLDMAHLIPIPAQSTAAVFGEKALTIIGRRLAVINEANGQAVNPEPVANLFDLSLRPMDHLAFPPLEYRLTDATSMDEAGSFWVINIFNPAEETLRPEPDPLVQRFGQGASHAAQPQVERLVQLAISEDGLVLAGTPPIQLELPAGSPVRNWQAVAGLDDLGLLIATNKPSALIFGFVPLPGYNP